MPYRQIAILTLLFCLASPLAISQSLESIQEECPLLCLINPNEVPAECDCKSALAEAAGSAAPVGEILPNGLPTASDVIYEAKAQYDARMADISDYYFVERSFAVMPAGFTMPGFFQLQPGEQIMPVGMPLVRFFTGELGPNGDKRFKEVPPVDLARMQDEASGQQNPMADIDTSEVFGAFAAAMEGIAGIAPGAGGPGGEILGGLSGMAAGKLREAQANILGLENSEDGFGGNSTSDGFGMALEDELIASFTQGSEDIPVYLGAYYPGYLVALGGSVALGDNPNPKYRLDGDSWESACISTACGANLSAVRARFQQYASNYAARGGEWPMRAAYVLRLEGADASRDIEWEGRVYTLRYAEVWLVDLNNEFTVEGPSRSKLATARRRMEYWSNTNSGIEKVVIDHYSEGYGRAQVMDAPGGATAIIEGFGSAKMEVKKRFSKVTANEGPPSKAQVLDFIAEALQDTSYDPLTDEGIIPTTNASPPAPQQEPTSNPATGREPLIIPGQGTPAVRERTPIIPREND